MYARETVQLVNSCLIQGLHTEAVLRFLESTGVRKVKEGVVLNRD